MLAAKPVVVAGNVIRDNKCDSKAVRRRATIFLMLAEDVIAMSANAIDRCAPEAPDMENLNKLWCGWWEWKERIATSK